MELDYQGRLGVGRGVYIPCFLTFGLEMVQVVQDLMYFPTSLRRLPHAEVLGVETSTQAEYSRDRRKHTRGADRLLEDARENVGAPSSQHI